jgi:hypothetical protein
MKSELLARRHLSKDEEIDKFYNHLPRIKNEDAYDCNYSWELDSTGYYLNGKSSVTYARQTDGRIFRLVRWFHPQDCQMMKEMYQISKDTGEFRVEKLITYDIIEDSSEQWLYYETARPTPEIGLSGLEECYQQSSIDFFYEYIDQFSIFFKHLISVNSKYSPGTSCYSVNLQSNREKDQFGHYWKNLKMFKFSPEIILDNSIANLARTIEFVSITKNEQLPVGNLISYAADKWAFK